MAKRITSGHLFLELAISVLFIVLIAVFGTDIGLMIYAGNFCDTACRDAARAAGDQSSTSSATDAANAALAAHKVDGYFLRWSNISTQNLPQIDSITYNDYGLSDPTQAAPQIPAPAPGCPGPYVSVSTSLIARVPFPVVVWNIQPYNGTVVMHSTYTFPIVNAFRPVKVAPASSTDPTGSTSGSTSSTGGTTTSSGTTTSTTGGTTASTTTTGGTTASTGSTNGGGGSSPPSTTGDPPSTTTSVGGTGNNPGAFGTSSDTGG